MSRKIVALGSLFLLIPALVLAGTGPRIQFTEQEHDFGEVIYGKALSLEFVFSNTGDADLVLGRISASCGCTKAVRGSTTVSPGASSKIFAEVRTLGMSSGRHSKSVAVHSNDPEHPVSVLKLSFNVVKHVIVQPDTVIASLSDWNKVAVFTLTAKNHGKKPVTLKSAKGGDSVEVALEPQEVVLPPGEQIVFRVSVKVIGKPARPYLSGKLVIETDASRAKHVPLKYFIHLPKQDGA